MDIDPTTQNEARSDWGKARSRARGGLLSLFGGASHAGLLPFEDVRTKLRLFQKYYKGVFNIPLDAIVGSVDRYQDFTREFLPLVDGDALRWQRVAALQRDQGLPPIEVYKVGEMYFVKDGNHRVSVMRQLGADSIEAHVWEYPTTVELSLDDDIDDILTKAERLEFLEKTRLDQTRPDHNIEFTAPGRYPELAFQIELYRRNLSLIDGYEVSYEDAAASWYDMVYSLAADTLAESGLLKLFPGRTVADLYTWVYKHRAELTERAGRRISTEEAAADLVEKEKGESLDVVTRTVQQVASGVGLLAQAGAKLLQGVFRGDADDADDAITEQVKMVMHRMRDVTPTLAYPGGDRTAWRAWRTQLHDKLAALMGVTPRYDESARRDPPEFTVHERAILEGVRREALTFVADDGLSLPAYVFVPSHLRTRGSAPAILLYPGHGTIRQLAGLSPSYHSACALVLAQAGFVTMTVEQRGFGELGGIDYYRLDALARLIGRTWAGVTVADGMRALDYLQSRPYVDKARLGVVGTGMSGILAMATAALDARVIATVIDDYLVRFDAATRRGPKYMAQCIPMLRNYAEVSDIGCLIAPRPTLYTRSEAAEGQDKRVFNHISPLYELLEVPDRLKYEETGPGRTFSNTAAEAWFKRWLVEEEDAVLPLLRHPLRPD